MLVHSMNSGHLFVSGHTLTTFIGIQYKYTQMSYLKHCKAIHHDIFISAVREEVQAVPPGARLPSKTIQQLLCRELRNLLTSQTHVNVLNL